ncbi:MAG: thioredoxin family protein [Duncaniella sp.]|nr:thioredoxin family protein [Duncaniella sp.]
MKNLEETIKEKMPTLVAFVHEGKEEASEVKPIVEEVSAKYEGKAHVIYFPNHFNNRVSEHFRITSYPCYILFKEGEELMRESGKKTANQLGELIDRAL